MSGWTLDPGTRIAMRLDTVRKHVEQQELVDAAIEAEELLEEEPDHPEGLLLLATVLLELGDAAVAAEAYEHVLAVAPPSAPALAGLAIARFETCDLHACVEAAREAARLAPDLAESHYYLGLALERLTGRRSEALRHLVAANRLDPVAFPLPLTLSPDQWAQALRDGMQRVDPKIAEFWAPVPMRFVELPDLDELRRAIPPIAPTVSGLYVGNPDDVDDPWEERPDEMRLFSGNLARLGSLDAIVEEIAHVLEHEADDWLGAPVDAEG